jgi:hypothetical protein
MEKGTRNGILILPNDCLILPNRAGPIAAPPQFGVILCEGKLDFIHFLAGLSEGVALGKYANER